MLISIQMEKLLAYIFFLFARTETEVWEVEKEEEKNKDTCRVALLLVGIIFVHGNVCTQLNVLLPDPTEHIKEEALLVNIFKWIEKPQ